MLQSCLGSGSLETEPKMGFLVQFLYREGAHRKTPGSEGSRMGQEE